MLLLVPSGMINIDQTLKGNITIRRYFNFVSLFFTVLVIINLTNIHTKYQFFIGASVALFVTIISTNEIIKFLATCTLLVYGFTALTYLSIA
ncbi:NADH dehydrogenase [Bacillus cereus]|nr:NADH dehydrogenase [Bacillus cereus]